MNKPKVLAFSGSSRKQSFNKKLLNHVAAEVGNAGADVTVIDLAEFPMPLYDGDLEESAGLPENAKKLKALFKSHDTFLIACPEYNGSITPLLKNVIDWVSRPMQGEKSLECYMGKVCALVSASPGALGGLRGLVHVRAILGGIGVIVLPAQVAVGTAMQTLDANGAPTLELHQKMVAGLAREVAAISGKLVN